MKNVIIGRPEVSVIVPVYNSEDCIGECLASLRRQDCPSYEVLVIDDGSTDASAELCRAYADADARFRFFRQENAGVSAARNLGLSNASGDYILFVDSDDRVADDFVSQMLSAMHSGCELAVCDYYECLNSKGTFTEKHYLSGVLPQKRYALSMAARPKHNYYTVVWNRCFLKSVIDANALSFDTALDYGEDFRFLLQYLLHTRSVCAVDKCIYYYCYDRAGSLSRELVPPRTRAARIDAVYGSYVSFWRSMGAYPRLSLPVKYCGALLYFDALKKTPDADPDAVRLYRQALENNGFTRFDFALFRALHRLKQTLKG